MELAVGVRQTVCKINGVLGVFKFVGECESVVRFIVSDVVSFYAVEVVENFFSISMPSES